MKQINLTQGKIALVSNRDWPLVRKFKWYARRSGEHWHACRAGNIRMHRFLLGFPSTLVDHRNRNGLDNRRRNMRVATGSQNNANQKINKRNTSGFKGVWQRGKRWRAQIRVLGKRISLGTFSTPEKAAAAYWTAARYHFGRFARAS